MTCIQCGSAESSILWTERKPRSTRRRHECACGARWSTVEKYERGSLHIPSTPTGNTGQPPPVIPMQTPANTGQTVALYSESEKSSDRSGPNPIASLPPERERARSEQRAETKNEFTRLLGVFCARWERSNHRPYPVTPADRNQLGRFMQQQGNYIESFAAICDRYLSDRDAFLIKRSANHTLAWLLTGGLAQFGGTPRETATQYAARIRREHEARKAAGKAPPRDPRMRDLLTALAEKAAVGG